MLVPLLQAGVPGGVELLFVLVFGLVFSVVPLVVGVLVYRDANARGSDHALAWGLGAFLGGFIVWILYAVVRDDIGTRV